MVNVFSFIIYNVPQTNKTSCSPCVHRKIFLSTFLPEMYFSYKTRYMNVCKHCVTHFTFFMRLLSFMCYKYTIRITKNYEFVFLCGVWKTKRKLFQLGTRKKNLYSEQFDDGFIYQMFLFPFPTFFEKFFGKNNNNKATKIDYILDKRNVKYHEIIKSINPFARWLCLSLSLYRECLTCTIVFVA